jgi:hypothetical protein
MAVHLHRASSATVSFNTPQEIVISAADDSIRSHTHDGSGNAISSTVSGAKRGLDVNVLNPSGSVSRSATSSFVEALSVASGVETTIGTYTVPSGKIGFLQRIYLSGTNIGTYTILVNGSTIDKSYTYFGAPLNINREFGTSDATAPGYELATGDIITVKILHSRPTTGDFHARIQVLEE